MLANRVREFSTTVGTGDITLGGAMAGHTRFGDAFTVGDAVIYVIEDGDNYEIGTGTYGALDTLVRASISETLVAGVLTKAGALPISLSGQARIYCAATAEFLLDPTEAADIITEVTPGAGVTVDGVLLKDGDVTAGTGTFAGDVVSNTSVTAPDLNVWHTGAKVDTIALGDLTTISNDTGIYYRTTGNAISQVGAGGTFVWQDSILATRLTLGASTATFAGDVLVGSAEGLLDTTSVTSAIVSGGVGIGAMYGLFEAQGYRVAADAGKLGAYTFHNVNSTDTANKKKVASMEAWSEGANTEAGRLKFYTHDNGGGLLEALSIDSSQNATFAGDVTLSDNLIVAGNANANIKIGNTSGAASGSVIFLDGWDGTSVAGGGRIVGQANGSLRFDSSGTVTALTLDASQNATFAGDMTIVGTYETTGAGRTVRLMPDHATFGASLGTITAYGLNFYTNNALALTFSGSDQSATFAGDVSLSDNALTSVLSISGDTANTSNLNVSGGNATSAGGNIELRGGAHATQANDIFFRGGTTTALHWDNSLSTWDFQGKTLKGVPSVIRGTSVNEAIVSGGSEYNVGANVIFYGESHPSNANDIFFRAGVNDVLTYDRSLTNWNFRSSSLIGVNDLQLIADTGIHSTGTITSLQIAGGSDINSGGNILLRGQGHLTEANDILFRAGTGIKARWDNSLSTWDFQANNITTTGFIGYGTPATLTIATGVVTATGSFHLVDTEASAATDDLDTINGGSDGDVLYLQAANIARTVVVKDGTGNLLMSGDFSLDNTNDILTLIRIGPNWKETSRSDNAA